MKRKTLLLLWLLALGAPWAAWAQDLRSTTCEQDDEQVVYLGDFEEPLRADRTTATIGTGTSTNYYPMPGFYGWQYDVYLYTPSAASFLSSACTISSIAWQISSGSTNSAQMTIWVKDVDASTTLSTSNTFSNFTSGATQVYSGSRTTSTGWNTYSFSSNFSHQAGKALLVAVRGVGCSTSGGCSRSCYYTSATGTHWYKHTDGSTDPGTSVSGSVDGNRSNVQITYATIPIHTLAGTIQCGQTVSGTLGTSGGIWGSGSSPYNMNSGWGVGAEAVYAFTPQMTGTHTIAFNTTSGDPDFWVLSDNNPQTAIYSTSGGNQSAELTAGHTYYLVADNYSSSNSAGYEITVSCPTPQSYTVSLSVNNSSYGSASQSGNGTYTSGSSCTITATPASGYIFDHWVVNGGYVDDITTNPYTFTVTATIDFQAVFVADPCSNITLPYTYGFEDTQELNCWTLINPSNSNSDEFGICTDAHYNGTHSFRFSSFSSASSYDQYLVSPELNASNGVKFQFYYATSSTNTEHFKVGYSITTNAASAFTWVDDIGTSNTSWTQSEEYIFPAGTKYVALYYYSNYQYRLFVDDLSFLPASNCPAPTNLTATNLTPTSATLNWEGEAESYNVRYKIATSGAPIFSDDFENGLSNWTTVDADGDGFNWASHINTGSGNLTTHSGDGVAYSESYDNNEGTALTPNNWLITPQVQLGGSVSFWAMGQDASYAAEHFAIYVSTTGNNPSNFTQISQEYIATSEYVNYSASLSNYSGMGYVAIRHFNVSDQFLLNIDDFEIFGPNEWITVNNVSGNSLDITGLSSATTYEFQVQANCGTDGLSGWSDSETFTTPDGCAVPTNLTAEVTGIAANLSWTGTQENYNVRYREGFVYDFESAEPWTYTNFAPCTTYDGDETGTYYFQSWTFPNQGYTGACIAFQNTGSNLVAHSGNAFGAMFNPGNSSVAANDWFILPELTVKNGDVLTFWAREITDQYGAETINVGVCGSTAGTFSGYLAQNVSVSTTTWTEYSYNLSSYAGQTIKLAINCVSQDIFGVMIDDIFVGPSSSSWSNPISCNSASYNLGGLNPNTNYVWQVQGVNCDGNGGATNWISDYFKTLNTHTVTINTNNSNYGTVNNTNEVVLTNVPNGASITVSGNTLTINNTQVTATPATNTAQYTYTFDSWSGVPSPAEVTGNITITANFSQTVNSYTVSVSAGEGGTVSGGGTFNYNASCTVTATAESCYDFDGWYENNELVSSDAIYTFTVTASHTLEAHFSLQQYTVTVSAGEGGGTVSGGGEYECGTTASILATPDECHTFSHFLDSNNQPIAGFNPLEVPVDHAMTFTAVFTAKTYTIGATADPNEGGTISGTGNKECGTTCELVATPATNYVFDNWTENGDVVSSNATYSFTVEGARTLVAHFHLDAVNITATAHDDDNNNTGGGTITGTGSFNIGSTCELEATPDAGYEFVNWTENGTAVSTSATYSFTVSAARDLVAHFRLLEYTLTLTADPTEGGMVSASPAGPYHYNDVVTITATPNSGFIFGSWSDGGEQTHTVTITDDTELIAYFGADQTLTTYANPIEGGYVTIAENQVSTIGAVTVGSGTEHNVYTPFDPNTAYSFAECIYLASEIQGSGTITSISYNCANVSTTQSNHIEVYMMNLDKASFANRRDFVAVTASDKVFDGTWTVSSEGWNTIILDKPFQYNGTDNLLIGIHENTPGTSALSFRFTSVANSSVLCFDNSKDMDPTNLDDLKNSHGMPELHDQRANVRLGFGTYHNGQSITLTAHANEGYQFVNWTENDVEIGTNDTYTVSMTEDRDYTIYANFERLAKRFITAGDWNVANNWSPAGAPDITEDVYIEAAATIPSGCVATANEINVTTGSITIADGGQLQHNNSGVSLTAQKVITGYTSENAETNWNYYLFSSPVDNIAVSDVTGLQTSEHYDLYKFVSNNVESGNLLEWVPVGVNGSLVRNEGYIYASRTDTRIEISGTVLPSNTTISNTLTYNDGYRFGGWNLIGNPFVCNAYATRSGSDINYYVLNHQSNYDEFVPASSSDPVAPLSALMVQATAANQSVTYSRTAPGKGAGILNIDVNRTMDRSTTLLDRARVRFGEGEGLQKFQFNPNHTKVYIPEGDKDFAVYYAQGAGTIPVNFKAEDNGRYTLDFSTEEIGFNYLHLIDNRNGNDVDLLQTPYYAFDAKSTDFASRFTLVFATGNDNDGNFAFFNNGVWIINNDGKAELQVVDALGRILSSETISGSCSKAINAAPGVYMLRLINGNDVKVQKVVVRR